MKPKTRSPWWQILRDLLALALIGFVLWLAAIGWLPVPSANAAPGASHHGKLEKRRVCMTVQLHLTDGQVDRVRPLPENHAARR